MKILYFSFSNLDHSSNAVYIKGLRANGVEVVDFFSKTGRFKKYLEVLKFYFANREGARYIFAGYDSPKLVIFLKIFSRKPVVYNALCSVIERLVISRGLAPKYSPKVWYYWLEDFLAAHLAKLVMLESAHQIDFFHKIFWVSKKKLFLAWTGADEEKFFYDPAVGKFGNFTVIFRGRLLPESGAELVVKAAKKLEKERIVFLMLASGQNLPEAQALIEKLKPSNLKLVTQFLPIEEVRRLMQSSHLSLGQLSSHPRLDRTIPHKAYESLAMRLPYLTARNAAVMELLKENETCLACSPADPDDLASKILWARNNPQKTGIIGENGHKLYASRLQSPILAKTLMSFLRGDSKS